jgi:hypothetical protein
MTCGLILRWIFEAIKCCMHHAKCPMWGDADLSLIHGRAKTGIWTPPPGRSKKCVKIKSKSKLENEKTEARLQVERHVHMHVGYDIPEDKICHICSIGIYYLIYLHLHFAYLKNLFSQSQKSNSQNHWDALSLPGTLYDDTVDSSEHENTSIQKIKN